jgi:hypothetical protein
MGGAGNGIGYDSEMPITIITISSMMPKFQASWSLMRTCQWRRLLKCLKMALFIARRNNIYLLFQLIIFQPVQPFHSFAINITDAHTGKNGKT